MYQSKDKAIFRWKSRSSMLNSVQRPKFRDKGGKYGREARDKEVIEPVVVA